MADTNAPEMNVDLALELFSIAGSLNSTVDLDCLLQKIGTAAEQLTESEASSIMLVTDDKKSLFFRIASGEKAKALKTMTLPLGQGIAGWVAENRQPQMVNNTRTDPRFAGKFDKASGFQTRSLLCVPMIFRGDLVGVVEVLNKKEGEYTEAHVGLLSSLASLASVAITNTKIMAEQKNFFSHVLELLVGVIETTKPGLEDYPVRAAKLACTIGRALGVDEYDYRMLYYAGILHKIGYIAFKNPRLLADMGVMSASEEMLPAFSARMLEGIKMLEGAIPMIRHHKEKWDGSGYPGKLKGEDIPLGARVLGLVVKMEELRVSGLRDAELGAQALKEARDGAGTRYDPAVVEAFGAVLESQGGSW
ncbi:MAG: GAF domain-containing protein [Elusimicrobia bacterium]|nr:GAF domain-containing protein [Elusimicrobiota bacterium]MDE2510996.1 GAF domain-containing protein [Elusimicrobiota bacterium]